MAKKKPNARRDGADLQDVLKTYADSKNTAMLAFLNDGMTTGVLSSGNSAKILSLCAYGVANVIRNMAKNDSSAIELAEKIGALIPARVRELCGDRSVLDALHITICHDDD